MKNVIRLGVVLIAILLLAGCGKTTTTTNTAGSSTPATTSEPSSVPTTPSGTGATVTLDEYSFSPTNLVLSKGQATQVTISNNGSLTHTYTVPELGIDVTLAAGKSQTITVAPQTAGTFNVTCTQPGHKDLGMAGTVTVQ